MDDYKEKIVEIVNSVSDENTLQYIYVLLKNITEKWG